MKILITGAKRGIGYAIARALKENYELILHVRKEEDVDELKKEIPNFEPLILDLEDKNLLNQLKEKKDLFENLSGVVFNAGLTHAELALKTKEEDRERLFQVNVFSVMTMTEFLLRFLLKQSSSITFISSVLAHMGNTGSSLYGATKGSLLSYKNHLAREYGLKGLRVNSVSPGFIQTQMTQSLDPMKQDEYLSRIALKRFGTSEEVAHCVKFLIESSYITGIDLRCDGGLYL